MKRIFRRSSFAPNGNGNSTYPDDSPEGKIIKELNAFCEAGSNAEGNEFVHLPAIVDNAESSANAAKEAAYRIRKLLADPAGTPSHMQYNAIMLIRILTDNPGHTFSRNLDAKFVATVKDLLQKGRDLGVQHLLRDTLTALASQRAGDADLKPLLQMWKKEQEKRPNNSGPAWWPLQTHSQHPRENQHRNPQMPPGSTLPSPDELASRITEANNSAGLLVQFIQSTPANELPGNELTKEFSDRCRSASRSMQTYIHSTNPVPDEDTLSTLVETNDRLSTALSRYQHALLKARKALGQNGSGSPAPSNSNGALSDSGSASMSGAASPPPPVPPHRTQTTPMPTQPPRPPPVRRTTSNSANRYEYRSEDFQVQNPFADYQSSDYTGDAPKNEKDAAKAHPPTGSLI